MTTKKGATSEVSPTEGMVRTIKGFDKDLSCMGFQFEIGKTYEHSGPVEICRSGFHGIDGNPLRVFEFYRPARSRYTLAEQNGQIKREHGKIVSAEITIGAEITLSDLTVRAVDWVIARVKGAKDRYAEGEKSLAWSNGAESSSASNGAGSSSASNGYRSSSASNGAGPAARVMATGPAARVMAPGPLQCRLAKRGAPKVRMATRSFSFTAILRQSSSSMRRHSSSAAMGSSQTQSTCWMLVVARRWPRNDRPHPPRPHRRPLPPPAMPTPGRDDRGFAAEAVG